jgi:hypothetical protein
MRIKMTLDRNRKERKPQIDSDEHRFFMDRALERYSALIPVSLECRGKDVTRDWILPLVLARIQFICVHLCKSVARFGLDSSSIRPPTQSGLMGAGSCGQKRILKTSMKQTYPRSWTRLGLGLDKSKAAQISPKQSEAVQTKRKNILMNCPLLTMSSMKNSVSPASALIRPESELNRTWWELMGANGS